MRPHSKAGRGRKQSGGTLVEAAIVLPIFFLLVLGILEFGLVFSAYHTMVGATRRAARYAAAPDPKNYYTPPTAGAVADAVCQRLKPGAFGTIAACAKYPAATPNSTASCPPYPTGTAPALTVEDVYVNNCTMPAGPFDSTGKQDGKELYVQVAVHRTVHFLFGWDIPLTARAFMRLESN